MARSGSPTLGIVLVFLGCLSSSIGLVLMKHSADAEAGLPLWRRYRFFAGFTFLVVNATVLDIFAYAMLPLATIAPFAGLTIVFSTLIAATGLLQVREPVTGRQVALIALTVAGVTVVSIFGPKEESGEQPSMEELVGHFVDPPFLAFAITACSLVCLLVVTQHTPCLAQCRLSPLSPTLTALNGLAAAACGALSQTFLKIISEAIASTPPPKGSPSPWASPVSWCSLLGLAISAPLQLYLLNSTLASSPVAFAVPLYQSLLVITTLIAGGTFFREFEHISVASAAYFSLGVLAAMLGLAILSRKPAEEHPTVPGVQAEGVVPIAVGPSPVVGASATESTRLNVDGGTGRYGRLQ